MPSHKNQVPGYLDEVKNVKNAASGTVITEYLDDEDVLRLDVRSSSKAKIWYNTLASNWKIVKKYKGD